jgi:hypothetical protein
MGRPNSHSKRGRKKSGVPLSRRRLWALSPLFVLTAACVSGKAADPDAGGTVDDGGWDSGEQNGCTDCGHGTCDTANNKCTCTTGWEGPHCNTCAVGYSGPDCSTKEDTCDAGMGDACKAHDDGPLSLTDPEVDLGGFNHPGRRCDDGGDAVTYNVTSISSATRVALDRPPAAGCLAAGDEVLLINVQGAAGATVNVGNFEILRLKDVSGNIVTFETAKRDHYGSTASDDTRLGTMSSTQRVVLQRLPNYTNVSIASGSALTTGFWNGTNGGVIAFRASGTVLVQGKIQANGLGYQPKPSANMPSTVGMQGESYAGEGSMSVANNLGAGGGGAADTAGAGCGNSYGTSAGGGGHGSAGSKGTNKCSGTGGEAYGDNSGKKLFFGSAGGSGGTDDFISDNPPPGLGGAGGGIVLILAQKISVQGSIESNGGVGIGDLNGKTCLDICQRHDCMDPAQCYDFAGPGGGGAGGSILLEADSINLGNKAVQARGGVGGSGDDVGFMDGSGPGTGGAGSGGAGGVGRVFVKGKVTGTSDPAQTVIK